MAAIGDKAAADVVTALSDKVARDLRELAKQAGLTTAPPDSLLDEVLAGLRNRLEALLGKEAAPGIARMEARLDAREDAHHSPWGTVQTFLVSTARLPREVMSDPFRMRGLTTEADALLRAFDVFGDALVKRHLDGGRSENQAREELEIIEEILSKETATPWHRAHALHRFDNRPGPGCGARGADRGKGSSGRTHAGESTSVMRSAYDGEAARRAWSDPRPISWVVRRASALFFRQNADAYAAYYTAMYLIQDTGEAIYTHARQGFAASSMAAYIEFWGVMQATQIQQDAIVELHRTIVGPQPRLSKAGMEEARDFRNLVAGHPAQPVPRPPKPLSAPSWGGRPSATTA